MIRSGGGDNASRASNNQTKVGAMVFNSKKQQWERADGTSRDDEMADFDRLLEDEEEEDWDEEGGHDNQGGADYTEQQEQYQKPEIEQAQPVKTQQDNMRHVGRQIQSSAETSSLKIPGEDSDEDWDEVAQGGGLPDLLGQPMATQDEGHNQRQDVFVEELETENERRLDQYSEDDENWDKLVSGQASSSIHGTATMSEQVSPVDDDDESPFFLELRAVKALEREAHEVGHFLTHLPQRSRKKHRPYKPVMTDNSGLYSGLIHPPGRFQPRSSSTMRHRSKPNRAHRSGSLVTDDSNTFTQIKKAPALGNRELQKLLHDLETETKQLARARMVTNARRLQYLQARVNSLQQQFS